MTTSSSSRPVSSSTSSLTWTSRSRGFALAAAALLACASGSSFAYAADVTSSRPLDCSKPIVVNGNTYDLSSLSEITLTNSYPTPPSTTRVNLIASLCSPISSIPSNPSADDCPRNTRVCHKISAQRPSQAEILLQVIPLATEDYGYKVSLGDREGLGGEQNLEWVFDGPSYAGKAQSVKVEMVCDSRASPPGPEFKGYDNLDGRAKIYWRTPAACPKSSAGGGTGGGSPGGDAGQGGTPNGSAGGSNAGGWGFFSWLLFLTIIGFTAYFGVGTYLNHQRYGVAEIPHRDFWREAPYLVKDAGRHAWKSISGQGSSSRGAYEPL